MEENNQSPQPYSDIDIGPSEQAALGLDYQYYLASPFFAGFKTFTDNKWQVFLASFYSLSSNLKSFISAPETAQTIFDLGQKYNLEEIQIYRFAELVRDLAVGQIFIKDFPSSLASKLNIETPKAVEIVNALVSQSFGPIIEDLKRVQRSKFPDKIAQIQKEAQPAGLTQPGSRQIPTGESRPSQQTVRPPNPSVSVNPVQIPPKPVPQPQPQQTVRPPINQQSQPVRPPLQMPPRPISPIQPSIQPPPPQTQGQPFREPAKPQFKIPDLGPSFDTSLNKQVTKEGGGAKTQEAQKSLEAELEKVANVIDLRNNKEK